MPEWTAKQRDAIGARNRDILVSAAAGSGKTSVLIERLMSLLRGGASLDRMLVVTFTRAAASEMRQRLSQALQREAGESRHLRRQYAMIGRADISTLHTFCKKLIKRHFQAVGADPMSDVAEESRTGALRDKALQEVMEALYISPGPDGQCLIDQYSDTQIEEMLRDLYGFLMAQDRPWAWLEEHLRLPGAQGLPGHPWYGYALIDAIDTMETALALTEECLLIAGSPGGPARYLKNAGEDKALAVMILGSLRETGSLPAHCNPQFVKLPGVKAPPGEDEALRESFKQLRTEAKALILSACQALPDGREKLDALAQDIAFTGPALRALSGLTRRFHERYGELKSARRLWDYNDLEHLALGCLQDPLVRQDIGESYDALFVDEYQDISRIQEAIIVGLHGGGSTLFMVGDVKQSIYRFRLADPGLFLDKQSRFSQAPNAQQRVIFLSENFRSRRNILQAVNHVFTQTLKGGALEITYDAQAALYPGLDSRDDPPVELHLIIPDRDEAAKPDNQEDEGEIASAPEQEAEQIAGRILQLLNTPIQEDGKTRLLRFRDMVILLRSASGRAAQMAQVLQRRGIPVYSDADAQYFDLIEVQDVLNLLQVLDNPFQDIPLLSVLAGPVFGYTTRDLAALRARGGDAQQPFWELFHALRDKDPRIARVTARLDEWRFLCSHLQLDAFLRRLIRETGLYARAGIKSQGPLRRANLRLLCERAAPDPLPQTLQGFLARVKEARRQENTKAAAALGAGEDLVRIMTVHKSKGLEFPVVFLPDLGRRFRLYNGGALLHMDADSGLALRKVDPQLRMTYQTFAGKAIQLKKNRELRSEEARLLYVAMTRAKDRLILLAAPSSPDSARKRWARPAGGHAAGSAGSMMDWLGQSLWPALEISRDTHWQAPNGSLWDIRLHKALPTVNDARDSALEQVTLSAAAPSDAMTAQMRPLSGSASLPLKLSVTQLIHRQAQQMPQDGEETAQTKRYALSMAPRPLPGLRLDPLAGAVQRGVATHRAMSLVPLESFTSLRGEALRLALEGALNLLEADGRLQSAERAQIDLGHMLAFFESDLGRRLLAAREVQREWSFSLLAEEDLVLQGVLDCCFIEDGAWVLIDYKTDRARPEDILGLYRGQMRWYMRALRDITGLPVKQAALYALHHGIAIPVTEDEPIRLDYAQFQSSLQAPVL